MDANSTEFLLRGLERIAFVVAAIVFGVLGYRMYSRGSAAADGAAAGPSAASWMSFLESGTGSGLVFMLFGAGVLVAALATSPGMTGANHSPPTDAPITRAPGEEREIPLEMDLKPLEEERALRIPLNSGDLENLEHRIGFRARVSSDHTT